MFVHGPLFLALVAIWFYEYFNLTSIYIFLANRGHHLQIILSQEKNIQKLNELVRSLRKQLLQCRSNNETTNDTLSSLAENVIELERLQILED